jgi:hypothetical protein
MSIFTDSFEKEAEKGNLIDDAKAKVAPITKHIKKKYTPLVNYYKDQASEVGKAIKSQFDYEKK